MSEREIKIVCWLGIAAMIVVITPSVVVQVFKLDPGYALLGPTLLVLLIVLGLVVYLVKLSVEGFIEAFRRGDRRG